MPEYVYGVVEPAAKLPSGEGIGGERLRVIGGPHAAALVSHLNTPELKLRREDVLTHARVVADAFSEGTVLPMRFGVVMRDSEEVSERLLTEHGDELAAQFAQLRDKVEMSVRATYEEEAVMRELVERNAEIRGLRDAVHGHSPDATYYERIRLGELINAELERQRAVDADLIVQVLSQVATDIQLAPTAHERVVVNAACLVERKRVSEFDDVLEAYAQGQWNRMRFRCTEPRAPHSFVQLTVEA